MNLAEDVDLEEYVMAKDDLSGADIKAVCTEAGLLALRERRMRVTKTDFTTAREKVFHVYPNPKYVQLLNINHKYRFYTGRMRGLLRVCIYRHAFIVLSINSMAALACWRSVIYFFYLSCFDDLVFLIRCDDPLSEPNSSRRKYSLVMQ